MKKVLIVEDELSIATFIADVITLLDYKAKTVTNGRKVMSMAKEWKPDLITLDIMMPAPDGIEILGMLKNDPETFAIPVVIVSAVANQPEALGPSVLSQVERIFPKPLDTKEFISEVQRLCGAAPKK